MRPCPPARRYDFCFRCATLLPETMGAERVTIKLKANGAADAGDESLGLGYAHAVQCRAGLLRVAGCGPRVQRDNFHRNCVSKIKYGELWCQFQQLERLLVEKGDSRQDRKSRRGEYESPCPLSPNLVPHTADSSGISSGCQFCLRNGVGEVDIQVRSLSAKLRRAECNTRKVQRCDEEFWPHG